MASGVDPAALEHVVVDCGSGEWRVCPHRKKAKISPCLERDEQGEILNRRNM